MSELSQKEKVAARRHCGYPAYGNAPSGFSSWRFFQAYGLLEFRLNNLADEEADVVRGYLTRLDALEAAIPSATENLDTSQAAVWHHNANEVRDREDLFDGWRRRLCAFLGVPAGPGLRNVSPSLIV